MTDLDRMSLDELVELRDRVARELTRRFEKRLAIVFTDVVGSTAYISRYGDVAGRELLQRHHALLAKVIGEVRGRIVDTAGDGAFCTVDDAHDGAIALVRLHNAVLEDNAQVALAHRLHIRSSLHWGPVLVDDDHVTGQSVHTAARLCDAAGPGQVLVSDAAFRQLPTALRTLCRPTDPVPAKGLDDPVSAVELDWRDPTRLAAAIEIVETGASFRLPLTDTVTIGRLETFQGRPANDIVLDHPDEQVAKRVSRWHLELEMTPDGHRVRQVGRGSTQVDGLDLAIGESTTVRPGSLVRLSKVMTLHFTASNIGAGTTTIETILGRTHAGSDSGSTDHRT